MAALALCLLAALILGSYELCRSTVESIFLSEHGAEALPTAWLAVACGVVLTVAVYNRLAARLSLPQLMAVCGGGAGLGLLLTKLAVDQEVPGAAYLLYVWKDVYIVVLVECFWSLANTRFELKSARWLYGAFCACGSLGAIAGARVLRWGTAEWGSREVLYLVLPVLAAVALMTLLLPPPSEARGERPKPAFGEGWAVLRRSDYLVYMLLLIGCVQLVITLVDYQFNVVVKALYPVEDARTGAMSMVYEAISWGALAMQVLTGLIIGLAGVGGAIVGIPGLIALTVVGLALHPIFLVAAAAKVVGKVMDYSLFRAAKEMLYLPLDYAEQTQGKALVDILAYRVAKAGVALMMMGLIALEVGHLVPWLALVFVAAWVVLGVLIVRRYRARISAPR